MILAQRLCRVPTHDWCWHASICAVKRYRHGSISYFDWHIEMDSVVAASRRSADFTRVPALTIAERSTLLSAELYNIAHPSKQLAVNHLSEGVHVLLD